MRKLRFVALAAPSLLLLAALAPACEDSGASSGNTFVVPESGAFDTGSGSEGGPLTDGAIGDAAADSFVSPAVSVTVVDAAGPKKDVRVVFHDAAGLVIGQAITNALGKASAATAPSMVTVLTKLGTQVANVTFTSVTVGDELVVAVRNGETEEAPVGSYVVSLTDPGNATAGLGAIEVTGGSGSSTPPCIGNTSAVATPATVPLYTHCLAAQNVVLAAAAATGPTNIAFAFTKTAPKPAALATVNVGPLAFAAAGKAIVKATNLPASRTISKHAGLLGIVSGQAIVLASPAGANIADTIKGVEFPTPTGFADAYQVNIGIDTFGSVEQHSDVVQRVATTAPASFAFPTVDFATSLPLIDDVTLATVTPSRPEVTVVPAASLAAADAGLVAYNWVNAAMATGGSWTFVVPGNVTTVKTPALPADAATFAPIGSISADRATYFEASQIASYAVAKKLPVSPRVGAEAMDANRALPSAGTLRVARWFPGAL